MSAEGRLTSRKVKLPQLDLRSAINLGVFICLPLSGGLSVCAAALLLFLLLLLLDAVLPGSTLEGLNHSGRNNELSDKPSWVIHLAGFRE